MSPHVCTAECGARTQVMCWRCRKHLGETRTAHANALLREHDRATHDDLPPQTQWTKGDVSA